MAVDLLVMFKKSSGTNCALQPFLAAGDFGSIRLSLIVFGMEMSG